MEEAFREFVAEHDIDADESPYSIFYRLCRSGNIELTSWFFTTRDLDIHGHFGYCHLVACQANDLPMMQWLYSVSGPHLHFDQCLIEATIYGKMDILYWMYSLVGTIRKNTREIMAVHAARGDMRILIWLVGMDEDDDACDYNWAFVNACQAGNVLSASYLYRKTKIDLHWRQDFAFRTAYKYHREWIARWLLTLGDVDVDSLVRLDGVDRGEVEEWIAA